MPASFSSATFNLDGLLIGEHPVTSRQITLLSGENRARGALLGKITLGAASSQAGGGNTGNGVFTLDPTTPILANAQVGAYNVRCITAAVNGGTFRVTDPQGNVLGDVAVGATFANQIKFSIADGSTDFVVGDFFTVTIAAGSGKYRLSATAAVDGSAVPDAILAEATDATAADVATIAYFTGGFDESKLVLGTGHTVASVKEGLRDKGIHLINVQTTY